MPEHEPNLVVTVDARPQPISIDLAKAAVIVIDMQNDFGTKGGIFDRAGIDISMIQSAIGPTSRALDSARQRGLKVVYLKMGFRPDLSDLGPIDSPNRIRHLLLGAGQALPEGEGTERRFLVRDTWNTDIVSELEPRADDIVIYKHRFSGFFETELDYVLKK